MIGIMYASDLVEEAVLLAERTAPAVEVRAFRCQRDRIYAVTDEEAREARFQSLHLQWFARLELNRVIEHVVSERTDVIQRVSHGRVRRALTRKDEGADLVDEMTPGGAGSGIPTLVLRLRPTTLLEPDFLAPLLHHELTHVADMLDPAFGYERALPASEDGPSADNILRERYRVVWDTTIDGRLARAGLGSGSARAARWQEFAAAFAMLGDRRGSAFERWFNETQPRHTEILAFATAPSRSGHGSDPGRCPLCRFPVASLDPRVELLSEPMVTAIRANHPQWRIEQGLCPQCLDLYEARYADRRAEGARRVASLDDARAQRTRAEPADRESRSVEARA